MQSILLGFGGATGGHASAEEIRRLARDLDVIAASLNATLAACTSWESPARDQLAQRVTNEVSRLGGLERTLGDIARDALARASQP